MRGTPASCTTPVAAGMKVATQTPRVADIRRGVMELYISDHPLDCLTCSANGDCELQDMSGVVGLREVRYGYEGENHLDAPKDLSNPYFDFDESKCIVCSRCVRACDEVQGTFALTIQGRGFDSKVSAGVGETFMASDCVSCGACVQACPTATLQERSVVELGMPTRSVLTTCAYCGVGCSFKAEMRGDEVVRMVPYKDGGANEGHSCVKGRFAFGYATHPDRVMKPMMRETIADDWREVEWDEAITYVGRRMREIQEEHGQGSIGGITSSRCTNEEVYVVQKMVRAAFGNNNVDTCARVCHSPTGYGLKQTFGTSAGTQDFKSVDKSDVMLLIGANPTDGHPVFASRMKQRLRAGAKLIVVDPRRIDLVRTPHVEASYHLQLAPGHQRRRGQRHGACRRDRRFGRFASSLPSGARSSSSGPSSSPAPRTVQKPPRPSPVFPPMTCGLRRGCTQPDPTRRSTTAWASPSTVRARRWSWAWPTWRWPPATSVTRASALTRCAVRTTSRVPVTWARSPTNSPATATCQTTPFATCSKNCGARRSWTNQDCASRTCSMPRSTGRSARSTSRVRTSRSPIRTLSHVTAALSALDLVVVQDLFLNETAKFAHVFLPGTSFLEKDGTFTNAERRINRVRPVMPPKTGKQEWEIVCEIAQAMGYPMTYETTNQIMDEIALVTPTFSGVSFDRLDELGSIQWPCNDAAPTGTPIMHEDGFVRGKGRFIETAFVPTQERSTRKFPLILTTGRILSQYNVGAQTRRTENVQWHREDVLEIHPHDAEVRGINDGDLVSLAQSSRRDRVACRNR